MAKWKRYYKKDIVITDPFFVIKDDDLAKVLSYENIIDGLKKLGFKKVICANTVANGWGYQVIQPEDVILGEFSAENSFVAVFTLDEIKRYNPDYDHEDDENLGLAAIIRNFTGRVSIERVDDRTISVIGQGNIDFYSEIME